MKKFKRILNQEDIFIYIWETADSWELVWWKLLKRCSLFIVWQKIL